MINRLLRSTISLAAIVEFIHTATLLHDDVVDASLLRRGQDTANARWGNEEFGIQPPVVYESGSRLLHVGR